jgi:hypothetical protein
MFGNWLTHLSGGTSFGAVMVGTTGAALGTNLINNVPDTNFRRKIIKNRFRLRSFMAG